MSAILPWSFALALAVAAAADPLVASINAGRSAAGLPALQPLSPELAARNRTYLQPLLVALLHGRHCDHDLSRWQAFQAEMAQGSPLQPRSEVMACPRDGRGWDPNSIVRQWLASPVHAGILLNRPRLSHVDCLTLAVDGRAAAICTLWSASAR
jgi:hypothetical protein